MEQIDKLFSGKIVKAHGLTGEVKVALYTFDNDVFSHAAEVALVDHRGMSRSMRLTRCRGAGKYRYLTFAGVNSREEAAKMNGCNVAVAKEFLPPCRADEFFYNDLIGCQVQAAGESAGTSYICGTVVSIVEGGQSPLLEIAVSAGDTDNEEQSDKKEKKKEKKLIPFIEHFIGNVDITTKVIELKDRWILD